MACFIFQEELALSLKSLQDKLDSLKRIHMTSADMVKYIKVTCDEMKDVWFYIQTLVK